MPIVYYLKKSASDWYKMDKWKCWLPLLEVKSQLKSFREAQLNNKISNRDPQRNFTNVSYIKHTITYLHIHVPYRDKLNDF